MCVWSLKGEAGGRAVLDQRQGGEGSLRPKAIMIIMEIT